MFTAADCGIFGPEVKRGEARVDRPVTEDMIFFLNMNINHAQINDWVIGNLDANDYQWDTLNAKSKALTSELQREMFTSSAFKVFVSFLQATSRE